MTAAIITSTSSAMPTAVRMESIENTMSIMTICAMRTAKPAETACPSAFSSCSISPWISRVPFTIRKSPPPIRMMSRQEISGSNRLCPSAPDISNGSVNTAAVSPMIQVMKKSSTTRKTRASSRPICRARVAAGSGSDPDQDGDEDDVVDAEHDLHHGEA